MAASSVCSGFPSTDWQASFIMAGLSGSRQFFWMNSSCGFSSFNAGSWRSISWVWVAVFPPWVSSMLWICCLAVCFVGMVLVVLVFVGFKICGLFLCSTLNSEGLNVVLLYVHIYYCGGMG